MAVLGAMTASSCIELLVLVESSGFETAIPWPFCAFICSRFVMPQHIIHFSVSKMPPPLEDELEEGALEEDPLLV